MDFSFGEDQEDLRALARRIFEDLAAPARLRERELAREWFDRRLWQELASAGLLAVGLGEDVGGAGRGFVESCIVLEEAGRAGAAVDPLLGTLAGGMVLERFGSPDQRRRWLPGVTEGSTLLTGGFSALGSDLSDLVAAVSRSTRALRDADGWFLRGSLSCVPAGMDADAVVLPARIEEAGRSGVAIFVLDTAAEGLSREPQPTVTGYPQARFELDTRVGPESLVTDSPDALAWVLERVMAAMCVLQSGCCQAALALTAAYTSTREQFGKPIATFQAVGQRAADAYVDTEAVRLSAWQAAWRLAEELPAAEALAVAKFWADDGAQRVVHGAQHLHGGVGVDRDYPLHRYYLITKQLAPTLGGATPSLLRLGALIASS